MAGTSAAVTKPSAVAASMKYTIRAVSLALSTAASVLLAGCAQFERTPAPAVATDDDAICRQQGEPGSSVYVACRKDRDVASSRAAAGGSRIERAHRNLADDMLNNR